MTFNRPGISDEFLRAAGVEFVTDPESHLRIPYYDREGRPTGHYLNPREPECTSTSPTFHFPSVNGYG